MIQCSAEGFRHKNQQVGREGETLLKSSYGLEVWSRSSVDEWIYPGPRDAGFDEVKKALIESHFLENSKEKGVPDPIKCVGEI